MVNKRSLTIKSLSLLLAFSFLLTELSYSAPPSEGLGVLGFSKSFNLSQDPTRFEAPLDFSALKEIHRGTQDTFIIHIQDAHSNLSGQENLAKTLDAIMSKYHVSLVLVEGGSGDGTLTPIKKIIPSETCKRLAKSLLMEGLIAGEEYLNLTSSHPMKIIGVEDINLYAKSIKSYASLADKREKILEYLNVIQRSMNKLKKKLYPQELLEYEKTKDKNNFEKSFKKLLVIGRSPEATKQSQIAAPAKSSGLAMTLKDFPNLEKLKLLQDQEKQIDFNLANLEQAALVEEIEKAGGRADIKNSLEQFSRLRNQKTSQFSYFQKIFNIAKEKNIDLNQYPNLQKYQEYLKDFTSIDLDQVLSETEKLEDEVYRRVIARSPQATKQSDLPSNQIAAPAESRGLAMTHAAIQDALLLRAIDRYVSLLHTAYKIQMSTKDFKLFEANEPDFATVSYLAFINRKLAELGYFEDIVPYQNILEEGKKALMSFYDSVDKRDLAFINNTEKILDGGSRRISLSAIRNPKSAIQVPRVAVLITGGYHTPHLKQLFQEKGYSWAVLTPFVTQETDQKKYENLLLAPVRKEIKKVETIQGETRSKPLSVLDKDLIQATRKEEARMAFAMMRPHEIESLLAGNMEKPGARFALEQAQKYRQEFDKALVAEEIAVGVGRGARAATLPDAEIDDPHRPISGASVQGRGAVRNDLPKALLKFVKRPSTLESQWDVFQPGKRHEDLSVHTQDAEEVISFFGLNEIGQENVELVRKSLGIDFKTGLPDFYRIDSEKRSKYGDSIWEAVQYVFFNLERAAVNEFVHKHTFFNKASPYLIDNSYVNRNGYYDGEIASRLLRSFFIYSMTLEERKEFIKLCTSFATNHIVDTEFLYVATVAGVLKTKPLSDADESQWVSLYRHLKDPFGSFDTFSVRGYPNQEAIQAVASIQQKKYEAMDDLVIQRVLNTPDGVTALAGLFAAVALDYHYVKEDFSRNLDYRQYFSKFFKSIGLKVEADAFASGKLQSEIIIGVPATILPLLMARLPKGKEVVFSFAFNDGDPFRTVVQQAMVKRGFQVKGTLAEDYIVNHEILEEVLSTTLNVQISYSLQPSKGIVGTHFVITIAGSRAASGIRELIQFIRIKISELGLTDDVFRGNVGPFLVNPNLQKDKKINFLHWYDWDNLVIEGDESKSFDWDELQLLRYLRRTLEHSVEPVNFGMNFSQARNWAKNLKVYEVVLSNNGLKKDRWAHNLLVVFASMRLTLKTPLPKAFSEHRIHEDERQFDSQIENYGREVALTPKELIPSMTDDEFSGSEKLVYKVWNGKKWAEPSAEDREYLKKVDHFLIKSMRYMLDQTIPEADSERIELVRQTLQTIRSFAEDIFGDTEDVRGTTFYKALMVNSEKKSGSRATINSGRRSMVENRIKIGARMSESSDATGAVMAKEKEKHAWTIIENLADNDTKNRILRLYRELPSLKDDFNRSRFLGLLAYQLKTNSKIASKRILRLYDRLNKRTAENLLNKMLSEPEYTWLVGLMNTGDEPYRRETFIKSLSEMLNKITTYRLDLERLEHLVRSGIANNKQKLLKKEVTYAHAVKEAILVRLDLLTDNWLAHHRLKNGNQLKDQLSGVVQFLGYRERALLEMFTYDFGDIEVYPERPAIKLAGKHNQPTVWILGWRWYGTEQMEKRRLMKLAEATHDVTDIHDHGKAYTIVLVFKGGVDQRVFIGKEGSQPEIIKRSHRPDEIIFFDPSAIHDMGNRGSSESPLEITIHAYGDYDGKKETGLSSMHYYTIEDGVLVLKKGEWRDDEEELNRSGSRATLEPAHFSDVYGSRLGNETVRDKVEASKIAGDEETSVFLAQLGLRPKGFLKNIYYFYLAKFKLNAGVEIVTMEGKTFIRFLDKGQNVIPGAEFELTPELLGKAKTLSDSLTVREYRTVLQEQAGVGGVFAEIMRQVSFHNRTNVVSKANLIVAIPSATMSQDEKKFVMAIFNALKPLFKANAELIFTDELVFNSSGSINQIDGNEYSVGKNHEVIVLAQPTRNLIQNIKKYKAKILPMPQSQTDREGFLRLGPYAATFMMADLMTGLNDVADIKNLRFFTQLLHMAIGNKSVSYEDSQIIQAFLDANPEVLNQVTFDLLTPLNLKQLLQLTAMVSQAVHAAA